MAHEVVFSPEARADLIALYDYIADRSGARRALDYVERVEQWCLSFSIFPERGTRRDDLVPGLRVTGFERRVVVAFTVSRERVTVLRVLYGRRDLGRNLR